MRGVICSEMPISLRSIVTNGFVVDDEALVDCPVLSGIFCPTSSEAASLSMATMVGVESMLAFVLALNARIAACRFPPV